MPVWTHRPALLFLLLALLGAGCKKTTPPPPTDAIRHGLLEQLGIAVEASENREFAYTDKRAGYFYGTTHTRFNDLYFSGWNIATKRVLLSLDYFTSPSLATTNSLPTTKNSIAAKLKSSFFPTCCNAATPRAPNSSCSSTSCPPSASQ